MKVTQMSDLFRYSDSELRVIYKDIKAELNVPADEMAEFKFDEDRFVAQLLGTTTKRKSVLYVWNALCEIQATANRSVKHESPETKAWSGMEATFSNWTDKDTLIAIDKKYF